MGVHEMPNYPYARISLVKGRSVILNDSPLKRGEFPIHPWNLNLLNNVKDTVVFLAWNIFISKHYFFSIKTLFYAKVHKNS